MTQLHTHWSKRKTNCHHLSSTAIIIRQYYLPKIASSYILRILTCKKENKVILLWPHRHSLEVTQDQQLKALHSLSLNTSTKAPICSKNPLSTLKFSCSLMKILPTSAKQLKRCTLLTKNQSTIFILQATLVKSTRSKKKAWRRSKWFQRHKLGRLKGLVYQNNPSLELMFFSLLRKTT